MAFRRRLGNLADTYLQYYLQQKRMREQDELIGSRQQELATLNDRLRAAQAEDARGQKSLEQILGDPTGMIAERLANAGMTEVAGLPLGGLRNDRRMGLAALQSRIGGISARSGLPGDIEVEAMLPPGLNPKDPRDVLSGMQLRDSRTRAFDAADDAEVMKAGEKSTAEAYGHGIGTSQAADETLPDKIRRDTAEFNARTPLEVRRAGQVAGVQQSALTKGEGDRLRQAQEIAASNPEIAKIAETVLNRPELLKDVDIKTRSYVLAALNSDRFRSQAQKHAEVTLTTQWNALQQLKTHPGKSAVIGASPSKTIASIPLLGRAAGTWIEDKTKPGGYTFQPISGTDAAAFQSLLDQFQASSTAEKFTLMRGLGHMSDAEVGILSKLATTLSQPVNEAFFDDQIKRAEQAIIAGFARAGLQPPATPSVASPLDSARAKARSRMGGQ